ncbi:hypothetical protein Ahu01nite_082540 [Winogradskya humida]|uniref:Uncharacterized protein n=1 Tax=Winogradskya humida TaxID=113566 RepID=A0ABQ4A2T4_9ACTN|nr:hypothetical protein Ahu01nite_082540 [Actinoplanes humidus]
MQAEWPDYPVFGLLAQGPAGDPFDDHRDQDETGIGVVPARYQGVVHRPRHELLSGVDVVALLKVFRRRRVSGQVIGDAAGVLQELAHGDPAPVVAVAAHDAG